jgi:NADP-dependent 3-hydroxy acid dehydrogenase YdfG
MSKAILVTGASDGLGKAIAARLAAGNKVTILSRNEEKLAKTAQEIGCDYLVGDVSDQKLATAAVEKFLEKNERIDCLVNNAGLWIGGKLEDNDPTEIEQLLKVNILGTILFSRAVLPQMKKQGEGMIININSQAGINAKAERSIYNASKWAVTGFTKSLQLELAGTGVRVTGIYPGKLTPSMFNSETGKREVPDGLKIDEVAKVVESILSADKGTFIPEIGIKRTGD